MVMREGTSQLHLPLWLRNRSKRSKRSAGASTVPLFTASSTVDTINCVTYGCVKTPAAGFAASFDVIGCGALSLPLLLVSQSSYVEGGNSTHKKNIRSPLQAALINATRSASVLATGLQKQCASFR